MAIEIKRLKAEDFSNIFRGIIYFFNVEGFNVREI